MKTSVDGNKSPLHFFMLVYVLALPFWLLGALAGDLTKALPINLPISALMFVCPIIAAMMLTAREQHAHGVKQFLGRVFDFRSTQRKIWYVPTLLLMPVITVISYVALRLIGVPLSESHIPGWRSRWFSSCFSSAP